MEYSIKRFLLFGHEKYEASGGWDDLIDDFSTKASAIKFIKERKTNNWFYHIVDLKKQEIVYEIDLYQ